MVRIGYGDQGLEARFGLRPARSRQNLDPAPARSTVATPEATSVPRPASTPTIAPARRVERELGCQLAAFFTSSAMRASTRAVSFVTKLITQKRIVDEELPHVLIHSISDDEFMGALSSTSKYNADWDFLIFLRDQGRKCAGDWLAKNFVKLGVESSVDVHTTYL